MFRRLTPMRGAGDADPTGVCVFVRDVLRVQVEEGGTGLALFSVFLQSCLHVNGKKAKEEILLLH